MSSAVIDAAGQADIAVIGTGPAGTCAARLLHAWGHRVVLIGKPRRGGTLAESIPPSTRKLFEAFGVANAIDAAGLQPWRGNVVYWGERHSVESFADGAYGYHVIRPDFDRLLVTTLAGGGVTTIEASVVSSGQRGGADTVALATETGATIDARFVLDCSGRAGVLARRHHLREPQPGPRTVALAALWIRAGGWRGVDPTHAIVETYADGWIWSVPVGLTDRYVTVMVDPRHTAADRGGADRAYRREIAKSTEIRAMLADAALVDRPAGFDASLYGASRFAGSNFLLVGDAGCSLDPLSSFGVKKALASGWLASIVAHTWLERPAMRAAALDFFDAREREVFMSYSRRSREFAAAAAASHAHPFWMDRAELAGTATADGVEAPGAFDIDRLRRDPDVRAAFDKIRSAPLLRLRRAAGARIEPRPAVAGREVVWQEMIITSATPAGVRFLRGVDLPALAALAPAHRDVGDLFVAYNRANAPVELPDFLGALSALIAWHALEISPDG